MLKQHRQLIQTTLSAGKVYAYSLAQHLLVCKSMWFAHTAYELHFNASLSRCVALWHQHVSAYQGDLLYNDSSGVNVCHT